MVIDNAGVTNSPEWLKPGGDLPHLRVPLEGTELTFFLRPVGENLCLLLQCLAVCLCSVIYLRSQMCTLCTRLCPNLPFHRKYTVPIQAHLVNNGFLLLLERASGSEFSSIKSLYQSPKSSRNEDLSLGSWLQEPQNQQSCGCAAPVCCQEAYRPQ